MTPADQYLALLQRLPDLYAEVCAATQVSLEHVAAITEYKAQTEQLLLAIGQRIALYEEHQRTLLAAQKRTKEVIELLVEKQVEALADSGEAWKDGAGENPDA